MLASTWLANNQVTLEHPSLLDDQRTAMLALQDVASVLLSTLLSVSSCVIVTSASKEWIDQTSRAFLPDLVPLLDRCRVASARDKYAASFPDDPQSWKTLAFMEEFTFHLNETMPDSLWLNDVISIGDSEHERVALHEMSKLNN